MARKVTKKRNSKRSRREMKRRQERLVTIAVAAFVFLSVGSFVSIRFSNSNSVRQESTEWVVPDAEIEILAPPAQNAAIHSGVSDEESGLSFLSATPTPAPTVMSVPTPAATAQTTATPQTAATPQPTVEPLPTVPQLELLPEAESTSITITAVGDCTLGGDIPSGAYRTFARYVEDYGYDYFFENVRDLFESDDLTIVNLEGPLTTSDDLRTGKAFNFRGEPEYVNILSGSSVEIANVANNHAMDFGEAGFSETAAVLEEAGIGVSGFSRIYLEEVNGVTVCSLGFTEWAYSQEQIERAIELARPNCDLLIVSIHWGTESSHETTDAQRRLGHAIIDAGADVVLGTHTHVYGGVEQYKGKYIVYSLGNFCFGGNRNPSDKNCLIFQQTFEIASDGTVSDGGISLIPARVSSSDDTNDFQPYILTGEQGVRLLGGVIGVSELEPSQVVWMPDGYEVEQGLVTLEDAGEPREAEADGAPSFAVALGLE